VGGIEMTPQAVVVGAKDIEDLVIAAPPQKEVEGRVIVEGENSIPFNGALDFVLTSSTGARTAISTAPENNGTFRIALPLGESQIAITGASASAARAFTYGSGDLMREPLRVSPEDSGELRVTLAAGTRGVVLRDTPAPINAFRSVIVADPGSLIGGVRDINAPVVLPEPGQDPPARVLPRPGAVLNNAPRLVIGELPPHASGIPSVGPGISPPVVVRHVNPIYADTARNNRIQGDAMLEVVVRKDGTLQVLRTLSSRGDGLHEQVKAALEQWLFRPATRDGVPIDVRIAVELIFSGL
jgi:TonB family protein